MGFFILVFFEPLDGVYDKIPLMKGSGYCS